MSLPPEDDMVKELGGIAKKRLLFRYALVTNKTDERLTDVTIGAIAGVPNRVDPYVLVLECRSLLLYPERLDWYKIPPKLFRPRCSVERSNPELLYNEAMSEALDSWSDIDSGWVRMSEVWGWNRKRTLPTGDLTVLIAMAEVRIALAHRVASRGQDPNGHYLFMLSRLQGLIKAQLEAWHKLTGVPIWPILE